MVEGETGLLVAEHDVDGYTSALRTVLADDGLRQRFAAAARLRAETVFDTRVLQARLERVIAAACAGGRAPGVS